MASFIGSVCFDPAVACEPPPVALAELEVVDGLEVGRVRRAPVRIDWRAARTAPISQASSTCGGWCFVIGHVEPDEASSLAPAAYLLEKAEKDPASISTFGGYYFAVAARADGQLCLGGDHQGHFPIYYRIEGRRLHFATSPAILRHVSDSGADLDPRGVITLLLLAHGSRGHTLWRGVSRLDAGAALVTGPGAGPRVLHSVPVVVGGPLLRANDIDEIADQALSALRPVYPAEPSARVAALLSGGMDSRTVAGLLHRDGYRIDAAVTLGIPGDIELECATRVARALSLPRLAVPDDTHLDPDDAIRTIVSEGLGSDCLAFNFPRAVPALRELDVPIVTGLFGDSLLGGTRIKWARDPGSGEIGFDALFRRLNRYGFAPETLRGLLRPAFRGEGVEEEIDALRDLYESLPGRDFQKPWGFDLLQRQRLQIGAIGWRLSFGSWPVSPFAQKRVHRLAARLPLALFEQRSLQRRMVVRHFPRLARLPLDGALYRTLPVSPTRLDAAASAMRARRYRLRGWWTGREPRYYARIFDFDGAGFRALRQRAAHAIEVLDDVFEPDVLRQLLPDPEQQRTYADSFADSAGFKSIIGLALLMERTGLAAPSRSAAFRRGSPSPGVTRPG
jgi:asparagine synthase (glutamine-hydrolysing)